MSRFFNVCLGIFAVGLFFLLAYQTQCLSQKPPISARIYGSGEVWRGHTAFFRIECLQHDGLSPCAHPRIDVRWYQDRTTAFGKALTFNHTDLKLTVPEDLPTQAFVAFSIQDGAALLADHAFLPVSVVPMPSPSGGNFLETQAVITADPQAKTDPHVELYPDTGQIIDGLPAQGQGRLVHHGQNVCDRFSSPTAGPWQVAPTAQPTCYFSWSASPHMRRDPWILETQDTRQHVRFFPIFKSQQLLLRTDASPFVQAGNNWVYTAEALSFKQGIYVDLWLGDAWIDGCHADNGPCLLRLPNDYTGPIYLDAYRQLVTAEDTRATLLRWAHVSMPVSDADKDAAQRWLQTQQSANPNLGSGTVWNDAERLQWMTRFVPAHAAAPRLYDSYSSRQQAFQKQQETQRRDGQQRIGLWLLGWGGVASVYSAGLAWRRKRMLAHHGWSTPPATASSRLLATSQIIGHALAAASLVLMALFLFWLSGHLV